MKGESCAGSDLSREGDPKFERQNYAKVENEEVAQRRMRSMVLGERREDQHLGKPLLLCLLLAGEPLCERRRR